MLITHTPLSNKIQPLIKIRLVVSCPFFNIKYIEISSSSTVGPLLIVNLTLQPFDHRSVSILEVFCRELTPKPEHVNTCTKYF